MRGEAMRRASRVATVCGGWRQASESHCISRSGNQPSRCCSQERMLETGDMYGAAVIQVLTARMNMFRTFEVSRVVWFRLWLRI